MPVTVLYSHNDPSFLPKSAPIKDTAKSRPSVFKPLNVTVLDSLSK